MRLKILLPHTPAARANYYGDRALNGLRELGDVVLNPNDEPLRGDALIRAAQGCALIVSDRHTPGEASIFDALPDLVAFLRCAVDIRTIDVDAASRNGVLVTHASPGFVAAVVELIIGFMVDLARGVSRAAAAYHGGKPPEIRMGRQLRGSTLGVIGYGAIGRATCDAALALGMTVRVFDPFVTTPYSGTFDEVLGTADFVVCLAVANESTENLMNDAAFGRMKRGAYFINVSRGNLIDEAALARALDSGHLAGAALDVGRAPDQMPTPALAARADVIATPHIGGLTPDAIAHQALETVEQCRALLQGQVPAGAVNAERAARLIRLKGNAL